MLDTSFPTPLLRPQNLLLCPVGHYNCGYGDRQSLYHNPSLAPSRTSLPATLTTLDMPCTFIQNGNRLKEKARRRPNRFFLWLSTYHERSKRIDVISRLLFPVGFLAFNFMYWTVYLFFWNRQDFEMRWWKLCQKLMDLNFICRKLTWTILDLHLSF